jgi:hypothetical protein
VLVMWLERPGPAKRTIGLIVCTHDIDGTRSLKPIRFFWIDDFIECKGNSTNEQ